MKIDATVRIYIDKEATMKTLEEIKSLNLNIEVPRSSRENFAGIVHLPRMTDKARAYRNETLGEYIYPCPLDRLVLNYMEIDAESFANRAESNDDLEIANFAQKINRWRSEEEKELLRKKILDRKPASEDLEWFVSQRNLFGEGRTDVVTYVDLNDLEEGHI
jgi:hypothetical protein